MRILMLNYEFPPLGGGASPVSYEIAKGYAKLGHQVDVVTMGFKDLPKFEIKEGINIYRVCCLRFKKETCYPWEQLTYLYSAKKFLKQHLKSHKFDANHTHFAIPTGIVSLWLKKKYQLPYVVTSHGSDVPGHNQDRFVFLHKFTKPLLKKIYSNAKLITTPSIYLKRLIKEKVGDYKILVIANGSKDYLDNNIKKENLIVSAGRLLPGKGFQYLIKAFNLVNNKNWRLYIVGDGLYKKELIKLAHNNQNIIFTGWLDNTKEKYKNILNKAKIFCTLSSFESQGIALIEAMSTGCAIVCSDISVFRENIQEDNGFLVNAMNIEEVGNKLSLLMNDEKLVDEYGEKSRTRYLASYQYKKIIKEYLNILFV